MARVSVSNALITRELIVQSLGLRARSVALHAEVASVLERAYDLRWLVEQQRRERPVLALPIRGASDDGVVRIIRDKIARGLLPTGPPLKMWAGYGRGHPCDGCGDAITAVDIEHELDFPKGSTLRFHDRCSAAWRRATTGAAHPTSPSGEAAAI